ncbi:pentatricopeptide repeat-containing protein 1, mitochondrial [Bombyx mori]|uniref:PROP1-like PPR domain-containing protein n=1 Tax=Bombyx mori TaxID=7091 RepID=A0A8R2HPQ2_BOMMO|nr:pentatricopeptide repeat-containing protein 1, mitochondrial [Bombyx mori]
MACTNLLRNIKTIHFIRRSFFSTSIIQNNQSKYPKHTEFRTEHNQLVYLDDPDKFGTLSGFKIQDEKLVDAGDIKEEEYTQNKPLPGKKLTTRQYADLIKQYIKHKRLKEAIDVLEVRMLQEDKVKPENYIFNILIGACADVGYTKKAFRLFNEMKARGLKPTGDTYTCLFHACSKSPWASDGLKNAKHLREHMILKGIEPNLTNYNAMIKAFGCCGDLVTAFRIVDEMVTKKIKIRVHTFNHLLQACISDKNNGLRHALIVWRKMLNVREKPNIYSFNLMLKCVKDCNLGTKEDIEELVGAVKGKTLKGSKNDMLETQNIDSQELKLLQDPKSPPEKIRKDHIDSQKSINGSNKMNMQNSDAVETTDLMITENKAKITIQLVDNLKNTSKEQRNVPNLLSKEINMHHILALQEVHSLQDKFTVIGGQEDFLEEMSAYSVKPDIKTFTQMLPLLDNTTEAENKLLHTMHNMKIRADIDFYNMLIKKRCLRLDYDAAKAVKKIIKKESEIRKRLYPDNKKKRLNLNIMSYGVLAMACKTKEDAEILLADMRQEQLKVNIEILGALLKHGIVNYRFDYVLYVLNIVKDEKVPVSDLFLKNLEDFNEKCMKIIQQNENSHRKYSNSFETAYNKFSKIYTNWLREVNIHEALKQEHPWEQFKTSSPETVQRQNIKIIEPKRFNKRNRKYVPYVPKI